MKKLLIVLLLLCMPVFAIQNIYNPLIRGTLFLHGELENQNETNDFTFHFTTDSVLLGQLILVSDIDSPYIRINDSLQIVMRANNGISGLIDYAEIVGIITDTTHSSEDSQLKFYTYLAGTQTLGLTIAGTTVTFAGSISAATSLVPDAADGAAIGTTALEWSDIFLADGAIAYFGADQDVTLTHVADTGLLLNAAMKLEFRDAALYINSSVDGQLDIDADTEVEITTTTVDLNGALDVSGAITAGSTVGVATSVNPDAADGATIGTAALEWSDLYLADSGVIYFGDDQDVTLTHTADTRLTVNLDLQVTGGDITGANGNAIDIGEAADGSITFSRDDAGTVTLTSADNDADAALTVSAGGTGALTLGDAGSTTAITSSDWAIDATGIATGLGAITSDGILTLGNKTHVGVLAGSGASGLSNAWDAGAVAGNTKVMSFYLKSTSQLASDVIEGLYVNTYHGTDAAQPAPSGEAGRFRAYLTGDQSGGVALVGMHGTLEIATGSSIGGLGAGIRGNIVYPNEAQTGTQYGVMAELYSGGSGTDMTTAVVTPLEIAISGTIDATKWANVPAFRIDVPSSLVSTSAYILDTDADGDDCDAKLKINVNGTDWWILLSNTND